MTSDRAYALAGGVLGGALVGLGAAIWLARSLRTARS